MGVEVLNPAKVLKDMPPSTEYGEYMKMCMQMIDQANEVLMLRGWQESRGATFEKMYAGSEPERSRITDDAMVAEIFTDHKVTIVEGDYRNIKITTPEDIKIAEALL